MNKREGGITLIALIITIIVLLILSLVTIQSLSGSDSAPQKASQAKNANEKAEIIDAIQMKIMDAKLQNNGILTESELERIFEEYGTKSEDGNTLITNQGQFEIPISDLYKGNTSSNNVATTMPVMNGVTHYFDNEGVDATPTQWVNKIDNSKNLNLVGATKDSTENAINISGSVNSYGYVENIPLGDRTIYCIAKLATTDTSSNFRYILGGLTGLSGAHGLLISSHQGKLEGQVLDRGDIVSQVNSDEYHVLVLSYEESNETVKFYIDGTFIGERVIGKNENPTVYMGYFGNSNMYSNKNTLYRFAAIANVPHSADQVASNSTWLINKYIN